MTPISATDARKQWSQVCDDTVRVKPQFIKRTRDRMVLSDIDTFLYLLESYQFTAEKYMEDDGSVTLSLDQIDLAENGKDEDEARRLLGEAICDYAEEYYSEYELYRNSANRKQHLPYVLKALSINNPNEIGGSIICRAGKN